MNKMLLAAAVSMLLAVAVPGTASAARHGARHHSRHASKHRIQPVRTVIFGAAPLAGVQDGTTAPSTPSGPSSPGSSSPAGPGQAASPSDETAGKVASFANGVLAITLVNGTTVEGLVTEATELECTPAAPPLATGGEDDRGAGDDQSSEGEGEEHGEPGAHRQDIGQGGEGTHDEGHEGHDGQGDEGDQGAQEGDGGQSSCTVAALVPGAVVREAELRLGGGSSVWEKVELVQ